MDPLFSWMIFGTVVLGIIVALLVPSSNSIEWYGLLGEINTLAVESNRSSARIQRVSQSRARGIRRRA